jgi:uncharacterized tellurite resistance protein B-like protein
LIILVLNEGNLELFVSQSPNPDSELDMQHLDQLKNLVIMASADGALSEREIALLVDRCSEMGLDEADLGKAVEFALSDQASLKLPKSRTEQIAMLEDMMKVMAADGVLSEVEKRLFALAAAKMGIDKVELESLIDRLVGKK